MVTCSEVMSALLGGNVTRQQERLGTRPGSIAIRVYPWCFGTSFSFSAFLPSEACVPIGYPWRDGVHLDEMAGYATRNIDSGGTVYIAKLI